MNRILMVCLAVGAWLVAATFLYAQSWGGGVGPSTRCVTESYETHYSTAGPALDRDLSRLDAGVEGGLRGNRSLGDAVDLVSVPPARVELRLERQTCGDARRLPAPAAPAPPPVSAADGCEDVGCVSDLPDFGAADGATMHLSSCVDELATQTWLERRDGRWVVTKVVREQVAGCAVDLPAGTVGGVRDRVD